MIEVRCRGCGRLLGRFEGRGSVKCPKVGCGGTNVFDTEAGLRGFIPKRPKPDAEKAGIAANMFRKGG